LQIPPAQAVEETTQEVLATVKSQQPKLTREESYMEKLLQVPELAAIIGDSILFKSSPVLELTESETEYYIKCIKHFFSDYVILQFDCMNTLFDQYLEDVRVTIEKQDVYVFLQNIH
jgi:coatomer protein complex subunit gamma